MAHEKKRTPRPDESSAKTEALESERGTSEVLVLRFRPNDDRPMRIGPGRARLIIRHFEDIRKYLADQDAKRDRLKAGRPTLGDLVQQ